MIMAIWSRCELVPNWYAIGGDHNGGFNPLPPFFWSLDLLPRREESPVLSRHRTGATPLLTVEGAADERTRLDRLCRPRRCAGGRRRRCVSPSRHRSLPCRSRNDRVTLRHLSRAGADRRCVAAPASAAEYGAMASRRRRLVLRRRRGNILPAALSDRCRHRGLVGTPYRSRPRRPPRRLVGPLRPRPGSARGAPGWLNGPQVDHLR